LANGKIIYYDAAGIPTTYNFEQNYGYDYERGYVETDDIARSPDGTLHNYVGATKLRFILPFICAPETQLTALEAAWATRRAVDLYLDADEAKTITGLIMKSPAARVQPAFIAGVPTYSFELEIEES
jgi:hypothetical protein